MPYRFPTAVLRRALAGSQVSSTLTLAIAILLAVACSPYPSPPDTARDPVVDTLHGVAIVDDYRWLEDQDSPETRAWIAEQNAYAEQVVGDTPLRRDLESRLRELMSAPGAIFPRRAGDFEYFSFRRPEREVAAIYRRPAPEDPQRDPIDPSGDFEVVVDPLDIHPDGTTSVSIRDFSPDGSLLMYAIRDGGQDEVQIRVRECNRWDLPTAAELPLRSTFFDRGTASTTPGGAGSRSGCALTRPIRRRAQLFGGGTGETFSNARRRGTATVHRFARLGGTRCTCMT